MIRLLALASLLVLLPLPLSSLHSLTAQSANEQGETGMAARPHFLVQAAVRVPAATSASVASRLLLPAAVTTAPPAPELNGWVSAVRPAPAAPTRFLSLLGKLLLDGG